MTKQNRPAAEVIKRLFSQLIKEFIYFPPQLVKCHHGRAADAGPAALLRGKSTASALAFIPRHLLWFAHSCAINKASLYIKVSICRPITPCNFGPYYGNKTVSTIAKPAPPRCSKCALEIQNDWRLISRRIGGSGETEKIYSCDIIC